MKEISVRLLFAAAILMLLAACLFVFLKMWLYAELLGAGALGCLGGALSLKKQEEPKQNTPKRGNRGY